MNYLENIQEQLKKIQSCQDGIILLGAGPIGAMALYALRHMGLRVICFADNSAEKQGKSFEEISVLSPKTAYETHGNKVVILAVTSPQIQALLREQLSALGFTRFHKVYPLTHYFLAHNLFKGMDNNLARDIAMADAYTFPAASVEEGVVVSQVEVSVTGRCSLKCRDCANCYPYYKEPARRHAKNIIAAFQRLADISDAIEQVHILGGEPFMSPDLVKVLRAIRGIPSVNHIKIITNGSVMPSRSVLDAIAENACMVFVSHYGDLSRFAERIQQECAKRDIVHILSREVEWQNLGSPLERRERTEEETKRLFDECVLGKINYLIENKLYACARAAHIFELGFVTEASGDCFDLSSDSGKAELMDFLRRPQPLSSCVYCNGFGKLNTLPRLPAALQCSE